jgi:Type ISP C-terminal specificity domain
MPQRRHVKFRDLWGVTKRQQLLEQLTQDSESLYQEITPAISIGLPLKPKKIGFEYSNYPLLPELFPTSFPGITTSRDPLVVDIDQQQLTSRMQKYFDLKVDHEEMRYISPISLKETSQFKAKSTREYLQKRGFLHQNVVRYQYRPFDLRWLYWEPETKLLDRNRSDYFTHLTDNSIWLGAAQHNRKEFDPPFASCRLCAYHVIERGANFFPLKLRLPEQGNLLAQSNTRNPIIDSFQFNLSEAAVDYLYNISTIADAEHLFYHVLAILHAPTYASENSGALHQDWARIPLPDRRETLIASATLGRQIAALLDPETPVTGITSGKIRPELKTIAVVSRIGTGNLDPNTDFALTAGWGHAGQNGVTMPGRGKVSDRPYTPEEQTVIAAVIEQLGTATHDIYLNDIAYWKNIPDRVWSYTIGGYQVIKKWLSYRELELLGRSLKQEEVIEVTQMARRIAAILLLEPELDANYETVKQATYSWPTQQ